MSSKALQLIDECIANDSPVLDLGNCDLQDIDFKENSELDISLRKCIHLKRLVLSNMPVGKKKDETTGLSVSQNNLNRLPAALTALENLSELICSGTVDERWHIDDLTPIQHLRQLTCLQLDHNQITDISILTQLTSLEVLSLAGNKLTTLTNIGRLQRLKTLNVSDNNILTTAALEELTSLRELYIARNRILNLQELHTLWFLEYLDVSGNWIYTLNGLDNFIFLKHLNISKNNIHELHGLDRLNKLELLDISGNKISTLQGLPKLSRLQHLNVSGNLIKKINNLAWLHELVYLNISSNKITVLDGLKYLEKLQYLNASHNKITTLYDINKLVELRVLILHHNSLQYFETINIGENLEKLDLGYNAIEDIGAFDAYMGLKHLNVEHNLIIELPGLEELVLLKTLNISNNQLRYFDHLKCFPFLKALDISNNKFSTFTSIKDHANLEVLKMSDNNIRYYLALQNMPLLRSLNASGNEFDTIDVIDKLPALQTLNISRNEFRTLEFLDKMPSLQILQASTNQISSLYFLQDGIFPPTLQSVDLSDNKFTTMKHLKAMLSVPECNMSCNPIKEFKELITLLASDEFVSYDIDKASITLQHQGSTLLLHGILSLIAPSEITYQGQRSVLNWYIARDQGGIINMEAKCILFGNGEVGKTALSHHLRTESTLAENNRTHGILIEKWEIPLFECTEDFNKHIEQTFNHSKNILSSEAPQHCTLTLWDFGGQEYYHATHRLFMGSNSLYLLLWDEGSNYQDEQRGIYPVNYWINNINYFSPNNITLLIQNKVNERHEAVDQNYRFKIQNFNYPSDNAPLQYKIDIDELKTGIIKQLSNLPYIGTIFPKVYEDIKYILKARKWPYLLYQRYQEICREVDQTATRIMQDESQMETLIRFLDDIGSIVCFRFRKGVKKDILKDYVFTDPVWLTQIIYEILVKEQDEFDQAHVEAITSKYALPTELWIEIMKQFELIFEIEKADGIKYVVPQYLPNSCKNNDAYSMALEGKTMQHVFTLNYPEFLPKSNFLRLIVRFGNKSIRYLYWKNGFLFFLNNHTILAECIVDQHERRIRISIEHKEQISAQSCAQTLFESLVEIDDAEDLEVSVNQHHFVQVKTLTQKITDNRREIDTSNGKETLDITDFHFLYKSNEAPEIPLSLPPANENNPLMSKPIKIFISYSSKDRELRSLLAEGLKEHLSHEPGLSFSFWTDKEIDMGDDWETEISEAIGQSDIALLLVSAPFASSRYIQQEELAKFFKRKKEENYLILPVLVRSYNFAGFEQLSSLQFFKTYYADYGFNKPVDRHKMLPFDVLAENEDTTEKQLQDYYKNLAAGIVTACRHHYKETLL